MKAQLNVIWVNKQFYINGALDDGFAVHSGPNIDPNALVAEGNAVEKVMGVEIYDFSAF